MATATEMLSTEQAARELGITRSLVRRFIRQGDLKATRIGLRFWAIARKDLERFKNVPRKPGPRR